MLDWLRARNVALLDDVRLDFEPGLNVVTGETGVGKSVLLRSLALTLGGRAEARLVGPAGPTAILEAGFLLDEAPREGPLAGALESAGIPAGDGELVIRRVLRRTGATRVSSRIRVNGAAVPVGVLRGIGAWLAEIYSQGEYRTALRPGAAREAVDAVGGLAGQAAAVRAAHRRLRASERERDRLAAVVRQADADREEMETAVRDIEAARLERGETESLLAERRVLADAGRLRELLDTAYEALHGADTSAGSLLFVALRALEEAAAADPGVQRLLANRPDLLAEVEDLAEAVRDRRGEVRAGPARRNAIEERLALIHRLERRYTAGGGGADALLDRMEDARHGLRELSDRGDRAREAARAAEDAAAQYLQLARRLSRARREAAADLGERVRAELAGLGLGKAAFRIAVEGAVRGGGEEGAGAFTEHGLDRLEFLFSADPRVPPGPLARIASGGESTRFFLALRAACAADGAGALVFDEADTGTSGRIADAVGRRLRELAAARQVVAVTHLPQVAALGASQLVVEKLESRDGVRVRHLEGGDRVEEIARMLAGPEVTASAREHAGALLASSETPPAASS